MRRKTIILLLVAAILFPGFAGAASEKDFEVQTTENLITATMRLRDRVRQDLNWFVYLIRRRLEMMPSPCLSSGSRLIRNT